MTPTSNIQNICTNHQICRIPVLKIYKSKKPETQHKNCPAQQLIQIQRVNPVGLPLCLFRDRKKQRRFSRRRFLMQNVTFITYLLPQIPSLHFKRRKHILTFISFRKKSEIQRKQKIPNLFPGGVVTPGPEMVVTRSGLRGLVALACVHFVSSDKSLR